MATHADADIILKLYDLRREEVCRFARAWFNKWNPKTPDEVKAVVDGTKSEENAFMRQSTSYWEMAFSIVNTGAVDSALFSKNCGEGMLFSIKCKALCAKFPEIWKRTMPEAEAFIQANPSLASRVEGFTKRIAAQLA